MISICRAHSSNVKRWRDVQMALRWCAAGMVEAGKQFRATVRDEAINAAGRSGAAPPEFHETHALVPIALDVFTRTVWGQLSGSAS
jgi:hypothetical protein